MTGWEGAFQSPGNKHPSAQGRKHTGQKPGLFPLGPCEGPGLDERCQVERDFTFKQKAFSSHLNDHLEEGRYYAN